MDPYPDQEAVKASKSGGDSPNPNGCPGQDSSHRESIAVDSENPKLILNECQNRGLAKECDDAGASWGVEDFGARSSAVNNEVRHQGYIQGRNLGVVSGGDDQENGGRPISAPESTVLDNVDESVVELDKFPEPYFLWRVLRTEWGEIEGDDYLLLAIAVHAIMLESGFLRIDPATQSPLRRSRISSSWPKKPSTAVSLQYSLPEILAGGNDKAFQGVVLKLQILGRFLIVYGSLTPAKSELRRVCLNVTTFWPKIRLMMNFCNENSITAASSTPATCCYPEQVGFKLCKHLKDGLVLPLLIDLSDKAGSRVPSSFSTIPGELKLKILERLKGVDLARVGCVCSELWQLSSNQDLWKKTYKDEFAELPLSLATVTNWKKNFARSWRQAREKSKRDHHNWPRHVLYPGYNPRSLAVPIIFPVTFGPMPVFGAPPREPPRPGRPQPRIHHRGSVNSHYRNPRCRKNNS